MRSIFDPSHDDWAQRVLEGRQDGHKEVAKEQTVHLMNERSPAQRARAQEEAIWASGPSMRRLTLACLAATAAALRVPSLAALRRPSEPFERAGQILAQYSPPAQGSGAPPPQLPPGWEICQDEQGQPYYCNRETGETQWDAPAYLYGGGQHQQSQHQQSQQHQHHHYQQQQQQQPAQEHYGNVMMGQQDQEMVAYITEQLQEPQVRIVSAVVQFLGSAAALDLLAQTEQVQAAGGAIVPETGKPRTSGGIYYRLLKEASHLPREAQEAALQRIKVEGKKVKSWEKGSVPGWY